MRYQTALRSDWAAFYAPLRRGARRLSPPSRSAAYPVSRRAYTRAMLRRVCIAAALLVLPLALLLFAQWPLREVLHAWSRQANDAAQVLFALLMAAEVAWATRADRHLVAGPAMRSRRLRAFLMASCVLPWCAFLLWTITAPVWESLRTLEQVPVPL